MRICRSCLTIVATLVITGAIAPVSRAAQTMWLPRDERTSISYEFIKTNIHGKGVVSFWSSASFLSGRVQVSESWNLAFDLPFSHVGYDQDVDPLMREGDTAIGNPYFGAERITGGYHILELGARIPVASEDKLDPLVWGLFSDWERLEAFVPDLVTTQFVYNYRRTIGAGGVLWLRGGPTVWIPTDGGDSEIVADYGFMGGYAEQRLEILGGLTGRMIPSESSDAPDRGVHHLGITGSYDVGPVRPGAALRVPLNRDFWRVFNFFWTLNVTVHLH